MVLKSFALLLGCTVYCILCIMSMHAGVQVFDHCTIIITIARNHSALCSESKRSEGRG